MRSLAPIDVDDAVLYDAIARAKRQPRRRRLQGIRANVIQSYAQYAAVAPDFTALAAMALTASQKKALLHAYEVGTAPMLGLRQNILQRVAAAKCPFCGLSESSTLDHYLPKEHQPQFAVFSRNLLPCCSPCNGRKLDRVADQQSTARLFLHPYYDELPDTQFVRVQVALRQRALVLTYEVRRSRNMSDDVFERLRSHFALLDLANRYRLMALEHLRGEYRSFVRAYGANEDPQRVASLLEEKAEDLQSAYGVNHWLVVLYRALSRSRPFCGGGFRILQGTS